jgi:aldehyde dehydrogenase (NAD+)
MALRQGFIQKVGFTGSTAVGRAIGELCGRHLQTPCLELGGKNPMVVAEDADLDLAVEGALFAGFGTAGQRCTSLGTVIAHESVHDEFLRRYLAAVEGAAIGDPTQDVLYGPLLDEKFAAAYEKWLQGITNAAGPMGRITNANPRKGFIGDPEAGLFYHPCDRRRGRARRRRLRSGDLRPDRRRHQLPHDRGKPSSSPMLQATACRAPSTPTTLSTSSPSAAGSARAW